MTLVWQDVGTADLPNMAANPLLDVKSMTDAKKQELTFSEIITV